MKKIDVRQMFPTGICDSTVSKRTIISLISGMKSILSEPIYCIRENKITRTCFSGVINRGGCIFLSGFTPNGISLYDLYLEISLSMYHSAITGRFLSTLITVIKAAEQIYQETGFYPAFQLNSVYIDQDTGSVIFLPSRIIDFLNKYRGEGEKKALTLCSEDIPARGQCDEKDFTLCIARIIYLFFSKNKPFGAKGLFDITSFIPDAPRPLTDVLWNILHGRICGLKDLQSVLQLNGTSIISTSVRVPLNRRRSYLRLKYSVSQFLARRKVFLLILVLAAGVLFYLISDSLRHRDKTDFTLGLQPIEVVQLYFKAVDELNMDVLDAVFYKRKGREIKNEVSRIYVMTKLEQTFANRFDELQKRSPGNSTISSSPLKTYGIKDLKILQLSYGEQPEFQASYKKILSTGDSSSVYSFRETIYLKQYRDHWYIIKTDRELIEGE